MIASLWFSTWLALGLAQGATDPATVLGDTGDPAVYQLTVSGMT